MTRPCLPGKERHHHRPLAPVASHDRPATAGLQLLPKCRICKNQEAYTYIYIYIYLFIYFFIFIIIYLFMYCICVYIYVCIYRLFCMYTFFGRSRNIHSTPNPENPNIPQAFKPSSPKVAYYPSCCNCPGSGRRDLLNDPA